MTTQGEASAETVRMLLADNHRLFREGVASLLEQADDITREKTVGNHISNIFAKLQVNDRSQAIVRALRGGLVEHER